MAYKPPMVHLLLQPGAGQPVVELNKYVTVDSNPSLTWTIESPTQLAAFSAPDVTLEGYDLTGYVKGLFANITPTSTDFTLLILGSIWNAEAATGFGSYFGDLIMNGFVVPSTLQFDTVTGRFQFGLLGIARKLATTTASTSTCVWAS